MCNAYDALHARLFVVAIDVAAFVVVAAVVVVSVVIVVYIKFYVSVPESAILHTQTYRKK